MKQGKKSNAYFYGFGSYLEEVFKIQFSCNWNETKLPWWGTCNLVVTQVLRDKVGSTIRAENSRQEWFWGIIHGQEGEKGAECSSLEMRCLIGLQPLAYEVAHTDSLCHSRCVNFLIYSNAALFLCLNHGPLHTKAETLSKIWISEVLRYIKKWQEYHLNILK